MKQVIFLLHGMGTHIAGEASGTGWDKSYVEAIKNAYAQYPELSEEAFDERFTVKAVSYDQIFRNLVKQWADNSAIITKLVSETGLPGTRFFEWLEGAGELKDNFFWTHAADVLLYRGFRLVREAVCTHVAKEMTDVINKQRKTGRSSWSVIAHSLGTAVLHDTLARITAPNENWPGALAFSPANEKAKVVMMVANVSKVLEVSTANEPYDAYGREDADGVFHTTVAPGSASSADRVCLFYLNARNRYDPFTIPKMFDPEHWPDAAAAQDKKYQYIEVDHIHELNVHDFGHYMMHPKVHVPLFRCLTDYDFIPDERFDRKLREFPKYGELGEDASIELRNRLIKMLPARDMEWTILGSLWKSLFD